MNPPYRIVYVPMKLVEATHKIMAKRYEEQVKQQKQEPLKPQGLLKRLFNPIK